MTKKANGGPVVKEGGQEHLTGITSAEILALLKAKHAGDVFIPECKDGETWAADGLLKLDAWVMKRSWSPLTTIGYEIKVSRQDFEQDEKWMRYTDLCHQFYFVCPAGLIREEDLPKGIGLMWVSKAGNLHTRRKAEATEPDTQKWSGLLTYVLMSRSQIVANMHKVYGDGPTRMEAMRAEVEKATERGSLAEFIQGHIREVYEKAQKIELGLSNREYHIQRFTEKLAKFGIVWDAENADWQEINRVENEIDRLSKKVNWQTLNDMRHLARTLTEAADDIEELRKRNTEENKG